MRLSKYVVFAVVVSFVVPALVAQTYPARERIRLTADINRYRGSDDASTHIEIAYAFPRKVADLQGRYLGLQWCH